jgi:hypothetical protein
MVERKYVNNSDLGMRLGVAVRRPWSHNFDSTTQLHKLSTTRENCVTAVPARMDRALDDVISERQVLSQSLPPMINAREANCPGRRGITTAPETVVHHETA